MAMNFVRENMNPNGENIGDCVLRAIAKLEEGNKSYNEILNEMKELHPGFFESRDDAYKLPVVHEHYLEELGYLNFRTDVNYIKTRYRITSVNMASLFAKDMGYDVFASTNTHAVAALKDGSFSDTWNSGRKRVTEIWIKDTDNKIKDTIGDYYQNYVWFERLPNGTINTYFRNNIIAKFKNGERIS